MKRKLYLLVLLLVFCNCHFEDTNERFERLKNIDYKQYKNKSVSYRKGIYLFQQDNEELLYVKKRLLGNGIKRVATDFNDKEIYLDSDKKEKLQKILSSFDKLHVMHLSVDNNDNVFVIYSIGRCMYYFLKLSPSSTLLELKKEYYTKYKDDWYFYKRCSE